MTARSQKLLWAGLAVAVLLGAVWEFFPLPDAQAVLDNVPKIGPGFVGRDIPLDTYEQASLKRIGTVKRVYQFYNQRFLFLMLDGSRNRHAVHDPVYCFRGAGWDVVSSEALPIEGGEAARVRLRKSGRETEAVFWFSDGVSRHASAPRYWWQTTLRRLTLGCSGDEPVLIILQPVGDGSLDWQELVNELGPFVDP